MNLSDIFTNDSQKPLPKPNAVRRVSGDDGPWSPEHVRGIICNPCYAGVGPYPGLVPEAAWVHAAARTIHEDGAEQFLVNMLEMLRESFEHAHLQFGEAEDEQTVELSKDLKIRSHKSEVRGQQLLFVRSQS